MSFPIICQRFPPSAALSQSSELRNIRTEFIVICDEHSIIIQTQNQRLPLSVVDSVPGAPVTGGEKAQYTQE